MKPLLWFLRLVGRPLEPTTTVYDRMRADMERDRVARAERAKRHFEITVSRGAEKIS